MDRGAGGFEARVSGFLLVDRCDDEIGPIPAAYLVASDDMENPTAGMALMPTRGSSTRAGS